MTGEEVKLGIWNSTRTFSVFLPPMMIAFFEEKNPTNNISLNDNIFKK